MRFETTRQVWSDRFRTARGELSIVMMVGLFVLGWSAYMKPPISARQAIRVASEKGDIHTLEAASLEELRSPDEMSTLPIVAAARCGRAAAVEFMLQRGVDPNTPLPYDGTILIAAALYGNTDVVRVLLKHGASVEGRDGLGRDALIAAAASGNPQCVKLLLEAGANPHHVDHEGWSALRYATEDHDADCLRLLSSKI